MSKYLRSWLSLEPLEVRENPSAGLETFDSAVIPALPSGWAEWSNNNSSVFSTASGQGVSGSVGVVSSGGSKAAGLAWQTQQVSGDAGASALVKLDSLVPTLVVARGTNLGTSTPTYLAAAVTRGASVSILEVTNGAARVLATVTSPPSSYFSGGWVKVSIVPNGSSVAVQLVRQDTGQYLNSRGAWQAAATSALTAATALPDVSGYVGIGRGALYSGAVSVDNFQPLAPAAEVSQSFDSVSPGQLPPGWSGWAGGPAANFTASPTQALSPHNGFTSLGGSASAARAWSNTALPADVTASASVYLNSLIPAQIFVRGSNLNSAAPTYYGVSVTRGLEVSLVAVVNGVTTTLGAVKSAAYFSQQWVQVQITAKGGELLVTLFRTDTNQWLTSNGTWSSNPTYALDVQDTKITSGGAAGVGRAASYAGSVTFDDFAAGPAATTGPAVTVTSSAGSTSPVSGKVTFQAAVTGDFTRLSFIFNGQVQATSTTSPGQWTLDTSTLADGTYTLTVLAVGLDGVVGTASYTFKVANTFTIPQHYPHIRIAQLAYAGNPMGPVEQQLLGSSVDLVVSNPQYMGAIDAAAPNTPQMIYSNVSNLYQGLLLDWLNYARANGIDPESAFYHVTRPTAFSGDSPSSQPVTWYWGVYQSNATGSAVATDLTSAAHTNSGTGFSLGSSGQWTAVGYPERYAELNLAINRAAAAGWSGVWQYVTAVDANGNPIAWKTLTLKGDGTNGMAQSGKVTFDPPADWVAANVSGGQMLYYLRFVVTSGTAAQAPVLQTLLAADYTGSNGKTTGVIPVFDFAADKNHDGYLNDAEWANRAAGSDARFAYQSRLFYPGYGQMRFVTNPSSADFQAWAGKYSAELLAQYPLADGIFLDNQTGKVPFQGVSVAESTANFSSDSGSLVAAIGRAIGPRKIVMVNAAGGGSQSAVVAAAANVVFQEFLLRPLTHNWTQVGDTYGLVMQMLAASSTSTVVIDSLPYGGSPTDPRTQIATLAYYYLMADPVRTMLMFYGGYNPASTWSEHWSPAAAVDIGTPTGTMQTVATGADPANTALTYKVFGRTYSDGLVLYKPLSYKQGVGSGGLSDATATPVALNGNYRVVNADGSLGPVVNSITLRNGEGAILVKA